MRSIARRLTQSLRGMGRGDRSEATLAEARKQTALTRRQNQLQTGAILVAVASIGVVVLLAYIRPASSPPLSSELPQISSIKLLWYGSTSYLSTGAPFELSDLPGIDNCDSSFRDELTTFGLTPIQPIGVIGLSAPEAGRTSIVDVRLVVVRQAALPADSVVFHCADERGGPNDGTRLQLDLSTESVRVQIREFEAVVDEYSIPPGSITNESIYESIMLDPVGEESLLYEFRLEIVAIVDGEMQTIRIGDDSVPLRSVHLERLPQEFREITWVDWLGIWEES